MDYYSAVTKKQLLTHTTLMNLQGIVLSGNKQTNTKKSQKVTYHTIHFYYILEMTKFPKRKTDL